MNQDVDMTLYGQSATRKTKLFEVTEVIKLDLELSRKGEDLSSNTNETTD